MRTVVPSPSTLATAISPPQLSTRRRLIANPNPLPFVRVEKCGSNKRACTLAGIPLPSSRTAIATRSAPASTRTSTHVAPAMVILGFGVFAHPAHGVNTGKERRKLDRPAQRAVFAFPPVEVRQCGVYLVIR